MLLLGHILVMHNKAVAVLGVIILLLIALFTRKLEPYDFVIVLLGGLFYQYLQETLNGCSILPRREEDV